jgi:Plasmid stabilization system protein
MPEKYRLLLSVVADRHLSEIYEYGILQWGEQQADRYYDAILSHFELLCENPFLYAEIADIRPGYRRSVCGMHSIYYRVVSDYIEIMAVLGKQDMEKYL